MKIRTAFAVAFILALFAIPVSAGKIKYMDTPTLTAVGATQHTIDILVTAGSVTGAPAGFSIQWMTSADYAANGGWYLSDDPRLCKASFSGNAYASRYNLGPGGSVVITIGDILPDNGASTSCPGDLSCGTEYVFRAFAHATSTIYRSDFTPNLYASTADCVDCARHGYGYWKTHLEEWSGVEMDLGNRHYTNSELVAIMLTDPAYYNCGTKRNPRANGLVQLAHMLITAKLNGGTDADAVVLEADTMIGGLVVPPAGTDCLDPSTVKGLDGRLNAVHHCAANP